MANVPLFSWTWELWGFQADVTSTNASLFQWELNRSPRPPAPRPRLAQSDRSVVSGKRRTSQLDWRSQMTVAGERHRCLCWPLSTPHSFMCEDAGGYIRVCVYIYTRTVRGQATQTSRTLTRLHSYIWTVGRSRLSHSLWLLHWGYSFHQLLPPKLENGDIYFYMATFLILEPRKHTLWNRCEEYFQCKKSLFNWRLSMSVDHCTCVSSFYSTIFSSLEFCHPTFFWWSLTICI